MCVKFIDAYRVWYLVQVQFVHKLPDTNANCRVLCRVKCLHVVAEYNAELRSFMPIAE